MGTGAMLNTKRPRPCSIWHEVINVSHIKAALLLVCYM